MHDLRVFFNDSVLPAVARGSRSRATVFKRVFDGTESPPKNIDYCTQGHLLTLMQYVMEDGTGMREGCWSEDMFQGWVCRAVLHG